MKKIFTIFVVILFIASITGCKQKSKVNNNDYSRDEPVKQEINITWQKRFEGKFAAVAASIQQTNDGGYVVAGGTCGLDSYYLYRAENYDAYILKLDSHGNIEWEKIYGGKRVDFIHSIQQTKDNGYICAGYTGSFDNPKKGESWHYDAYVLKLDSNGNLEWEKAYGGKLDDTASCIKQTKDGGYIVAGGTYRLDVAYISYILKLDSNGNLEWEKAYGGSSGELLSIEQTISGYIATGDGWDILCIDLEGNLIWQKDYSEEYVGSAKCIQQTKDGGYIVTGEILMDKKCYDICILKLDSNGNLEWEKAYGGNYCDSAYYIKQTKDDGYIVAGTLDITEEDRKGYAGILKLDSKGNLEWQIKLKGKGSSADCVLQTNDGGYIVAGGEDIVRQDYKGDEDYKKIKSVMYILKLESKKMK